MKDYVIKQVIPIPRGRDYYAVYSEVGEDGRFLKANPINYLVLVEDAGGTSIEGLVLLDGLFKLTGEAENCVGIYTCEEIKENFPETRVVYKY